MSEPLYKIKETYLKALDDLVVDDFIDYQSLNDTLLSIQDEFKEKAINIGSYIKNLSLKIDALEKYETEIKKRKNIIKNKKSFLKSYLMKNMIESEIKKIEGIEFDIKLHETPPHLEIDNLNIIPEKYIKIITSPDIISIKKDLLAGEIIEGASIKKGFHLKIG